TAEFANAFVEGRIIFGDREYSIETSLGPAGSPLAYGLWEWADALENPDVAPRNTDLVLTLSRLDATVADMARGVAALQSAIASAPASVIHRMEQARAQRQAVFQVRLRNDDQ